MERSTGQEMMQSRSTVISLVNEDSSTIILERIEDVLLVK